MDITTEPPCFTAGLGTHDSKGVNARHVLRYSERRFGTSYPRPLISPKLDDRWRTAIWLEKSDRSDERITRLENGAVLARSVRRKVEGKR